MKRFIIPSTLIVALAAAAWFFASPLLGPVPIRTFLQIADTLPPSKNYQVVESLSYGHSPIASTLPLRLKPALALAKLMAGRPRIISSPDLTMELVYNDESSHSTYHIYVHIRNGDVWFLDLVGDPSSSEEISRKKHLFHRSFPHLLIRSRLLRKD